MLPLFIGMLLLSNVASLEVHAAKPLDKIHDYTIDVTPYSDGSLYIKYHIYFSIIYIRMIIPAARPGQVTHM